MVNSVFEVICGGDLCGDVLKVMCGDGVKVMCGGQ